VRRKAGTSEGASYGRADGRAGAMRAQRRHKEAKQRDTREDINKELHTVLLHTNDNTSKMHDLYVRMWRNESR
jgi:hypothetical protein